MSTILKKFRVHSARWHQNSSRPDYRGRTYVVAHLTLLYGVDAVIRHKKSIVRTLNNAEGVHLTEAFEGTLKTGTTHR